MVPSPDFVGAEMTPEVAQDEWGKEVMRVNGLVDQAVGVTGGKLIGLVVDYPSFEEKGAPLRGDNPAIHPIVEKPDGNLVAMGGQDFRSEYAVTYKAESSSGAFPRMSRTIVVDWGKSTLQSEYGIYRREGTEASSFGEFVTSFNFTGNRPADSFVIADDIIPPVENTVPPVEGDNSTNYKYILEEEKLQPVESNCVFTNALQIPERGSARVQLEKVRVVRKGLQIASGTTRLFKE